MKPNMRMTDTNNYMKTIAAVAAIVLFTLIAVLFFTQHKEPVQYDLEIKELGAESMLAHSDSDVLGLGEILLVYDENMVIEDVNGQLIDLSELSGKDQIRVELVSREKDPDYDRYLDPVVERIILLPDDSDEYV